MENPHGYPNKRSKTPYPAHSPHPSGKGKGKMEESAKPGGEEENPAADGMACGICFAEERRLIRGFIDCCDHYFCFLCIMEWAKIESRCPMCKQRFVSIRRPAVPGVFPQERIVRVPARNQAPVLDNAAGDADPYADISCSVCHGSEDEHLLLLCDLCDSSAHTYCSGLGLAVPDGDWFCGDCTVSRREKSRMKDDDDDDDEDDDEDSREPISIGEIVRDEGPSTAGVLARGERNGRPALDETGARTLHRQRDRQLRVQLLRDNWSKFQSGSMGFRSISASPSAPRSSSVAGEDGKVEARDRSRDVDKAWKMLEMAKSVTMAQPRANGVTPAGISGPRRDKHGLDKMTAHNPGSTSSTRPSSSTTKTEIQSLVKMNLKSNGHRFGKDKFKAIARISTHSVLAACGLDHNGPLSQPISAPVCLHNEGAYPSPLRGSCRECFLSFVRHVVDVIASRERERKRVSEQVS